MKIKPHQTVRITERRLQKMGACQYGIDSWKDVLPAVISTNPDDNLKISRKITSKERSYYPWWITDNSFKAKPGFGNEARMIGFTPAWNRNGLEMDTLPQVLAAVADQLLTSGEMRAHRAS